MTLAPKRIGPFVDRLPARFLEQPLTKGASQGHVVELEPMLAEYYRFRGWSESGVPTQRKLEALGLAELAGQTAEEATHA